MSLVVYAKDIHTGSRPGTDSALCDSVDIPHRPGERRASELVDNLRSSYKIFMLHSCVPSGRTSARILRLLSHNRCYLYCVVCLFFPRGAWEWRRERGIRVGCPWSPSTLLFYIWYCEVHLSLRVLLGVNNL